MVEHGGFAYDADHYGDDLPFWTAGCLYGCGRQPSTSKPHLVVPAYTLDTNDVRFAAMQGFNSGTQFFDYLKDAFDVLYREGDPAGLNRPKMLSIGLHCRLVGRPARAAALARFLDYVQQHDNVWITRRIDIARHWQATRHPFSRCKAPGSHEHHSRLSQSLRRRHVRPQTLCTASTSIRRGYRSAARRSGRSPR